MERRRDVKATAMQLRLLRRRVSTGRACSFIIKETLAQVFSCEFCEISKNAFFTEHLRTTTSVENTRNVLRQTLLFEIMSLSSSDDLKIPNATIDFIYRLKDLMSSFLK